MSMTSQQPVPAPRLGPERLEEMRRRLEEARAYHEERIAAGADTADDIAGAIAARSEKALVEVESALHSLDTGEYGTCAACRRAIDPERLEALPHARLCARCASNPVP